MPTPGSRLFVAATALTALFGLAHFAGFLHARHAARHDPALADLTAAMRAHTASNLGLRPSILDFREAFSLVFSPLLLAVASLSLLAVHLAAEPGRAIRLVASVDAALLLVLAVAFALHRVPQGIVSGLLIAGVFAAAAIRAR